MAAPAGLRAAEPLGIRLVRRARAVPDAPVLDRLIRGRMWIGVLAVALLGVVFLQVSLLKLNTGIGRAVQTSSTLELQNADLRRQLTQSDGGEQLQGLAGGKGMVMPAPGDVGYVNARSADPAQAVANIRTPGDVDPTALADAAKPAVTGTAAAVDPTTTATPATAPSATAAATAAPATSTPAAATATAAPDTSAAATATAAPVAAATATPAASATPSATATPDATAAPDAASATAGATAAPAG